MMMWGSVGVVGGWGGVGSGMFFLVWVLLVSSEINRIPFDFGEGESELVSGFNTELSGGDFVLLFLSEYNMLLFWGCFLYLVGGVVGLGFIVVCLLFIRCVYPRYRYDGMMGMYWFGGLLGIMWMVWWGWVAY